MDALADKLNPEDFEIVNKMNTLGNCWELLYYIENERKNIKCKKDVIMMMIHLVLIKNDYQCVVEDVENKTEKFTELLPNGWNSDGKSTYILKYIHNGTKFHLTATPVDGILSINFLNLGNHLTYNAVVDADNEVLELQGTLSTMVPNNKTLFCKIWTDLAKPSMNYGQRDITVQTEPQRESPAPETIIFPGGRPFPEEDLFHNVFDPLGVGARDLNPLGVGSRDLNPFAPIGPGGGMLLDYPRGRVPGPHNNHPVPGMLPRFDPLGFGSRDPESLCANRRRKWGSIPPGARFDPINPIHPGRRAGPDPDHLPMPGSFENMFM